jgi:glycopeptide antibiotics resistance protein
VGELTLSRSRLPVVLWALSAAFIVYGTTIPFRFVTDRQIVLANLARLSLNPFISPDTGSRLSIPDVVGNVLLFVPFGGFGIWAVPRARSVIGRIVFLTILGAALSAGVETLQLLTIDRTSSLGDLLANTAGAFSGAVIATLARTWAGIFFSAVGASGLANNATFYPMVVSAILVCAGAWEPFDVTLDVGSLVPKIRALFHHPWPTGPLTDEGLSVLQHLLFTSALVVWLQTAGFRAAVVTGAIAGAVVAVALEASQLFIAARMPAVWDALVAVAGSLLGAAVGAAFPKIKRPAIWCAGVFILTAIGVTMQQLTPFTIEPAERAFQWIPFLNYYEFTTSETVSHSAELLLSCFPLGFALGLAIERRVVRLTAIAAATLAIAVPVEYGQRFIGGRYPDITDIALSVVGAWFGAWAATEGRRRFHAQLAIISRR